VKTNWKINLICSRFGLVTVAEAVVIDYPYADTTDPLLYCLALSATIEFLTILWSSREHVRRGTSRSLCCTSIMRILWSIHNHAVSFLLPKTKALFSETATTVCTTRGLGSCDWVWTTASGRRRTQAAATKTTNKLGIRIFWAIHIVIKYG
jgi:hypothetical protein